MKTPDITPAEIVALVGGAISLAVTFGVHVSPAQGDSLTAFVGLLAALVLGNAHVRNGRSKIAAAKIERPLVHVTTVAAPADASAAPVAEVPAPTDAPVEPTA